MDNLVSVARSLSALQMKANIISAYCLIFGIDIATHKLRAFVSHWSDYPVPTAPLQQIHMTE